MPAPVVRRPYDSMESPYSSSCSRLCNHPVSKDIKREYRDAMKKAKDSHVSCLSSGSHCRFGYYEVWMMNDEYWKCVLTFLTIFFSTAWNWEEQSFFSGPIRNPYIIKLRHNKIWWDAEDNWSKYILWTLLSSLYYKNGLIRCLGLHFSNRTVRLIEIFFLKSNQVV